MQKLTLDEVGVAPEDAAQVIYDLRRQLRRRPERRPDAFSVRFTVALDVPDPHETAELGLPRTPESLYRWLRGLVCNAPPKGVAAEVIYAD